MGNPQQMISAARRNAGDESERQWSERGWADSPHRQQPPVKEFWLASAERMLYGNLQCNPERQKPPEGHAGRSIKKTMSRILIVEDNVILRYALASWLRDEGHDVLEASTGDEAKTILSSILNVDLVITDVEMPGALNGVGLVGFVRQRLPLLPVIVVSARPLPAAMRELGVSAFFMKPYDFGSIGMRIAVLLPQIGDGAATRKQANDEC
jgi:CheY-like chemotaxis protein